MSEPEPDIPLDDYSLIPTTEELYETASCGYITTTPAGRIVNVNRTMTQWLGCDRADLLSGLRLIDLLTPGGRIFYETHLALLLRVQDSVNEIALDFRCRDGRTLPALVNGRQRRNSQNEPLLNFLTVFNASERRMYEQQLLAARDLFETTLASIGDGVIATDSEGAITFMNSVAAQLTGWDPDLAVGKSIENVLVLVREDNREPIENPLRVALRTGKNVGLDNHTLLLSADGNTFVVDDSAAPIRDENDSPSGAVMVFRDVSRRRLAERELSEAYRQLEHQAAELRRSNEDLTQFAYVASHDLRSPLRTVTMFSQLLEQSYGGMLGQGKDLIRHITEATARMALLIDDLLRFSTISSTDARLTTLADTNESFDKAVENLKSAVNESGAEVERSHLPKVYADGSSLVQLFQNLVGNAIRYRSALPPRIFLSAVERQGFWCFSCRDNGIGIGAEHYERIFEPFKRLHGQEIPGSGIGLAVCKKIVERCGGTMWVESLVGGGSTFFFTFPIEV